MAFNNSLTSRLDDLRSKNPPATSSENSSGYTTPSRYSGSFMTSHSQPSHDARASLQRRFTTDLSKMSTLTPIGQQPSQAADQMEISMTLHKVQLVSESPLPPTYLVANQIPIEFSASTSSIAEIVTDVYQLEKKRMDYEMLREQRKRFEAELEIFNIQQAKEKQELDQMAQELHRVNLSAGHQSEPTTPPEYRDQVYPSVFARTNRYSSSSLTSPPGLNNRASRSGSQLTSPPVELAQTLHNHINSDTLPSKSVPGSRRGSSDKIAGYIPEISTTAQRGGAAKNRYSMPVTGSRARTNGANSEYSPANGLGHINTTSFLFGDDDDASKKESATSPDVKSYLQMNATDDKFPILVRRDEYPGLLSASSAALDLALSQSPGPESQVNGWTPFARHRSSQPSLPQNSSFSSVTNGNPSNGTSQSGSQKSPEAIGSSRQLNRHSMEATLASYAQSSMAGLSLAEDTTSSRPTLANIQSSYSTSDIPTMKHTNSLGTTITPPKTHAQQHFHNHNASLGRIPPHAINSNVINSSVNTSVNNAANNAANNRHSRELSGGEAHREEQTNGYSQYQSGLQASAAPFGPSATAATSTESISSPVTHVGTAQYPSPAYYGGYGMQLMNMGMSPMHMASTLPFNNPMQAYQSQGAFSQYPNFGPPGRFPDSQARVIQQRRLQNGEENARFANIKLEHIQGEIYGLCKDQHGCRYLQKKLEERDPEHVHLIFIETNQHVVELMTDPFGNYLCQKLLEFSNDDQRTVLINNAAPQMVKIALNQHGTRALQKMIEFISTREQIQTIIGALKDRVVELIQDLNGNHVIQKCLNRLSPEDAQFIFDAVGTNCVVVGTHRHGCCVLQRCIDHASGHQKAQLISQITANAFSLVQDPFGNYVLQYIVDLAEPAFTDPLCYSFQGSIPLLSKQKFSSNVMEKCLRGAQSSVTRMMIEEMLNANELEKMLRDSFANYVVQTALDYADPDTKASLVEAIRPILPAVRSTPYGRRIHGRIFGNEGQGRLSGGATPNDASSPGQIPLPRQVNNATTSNSYSAFTVNGFPGINGAYVSPSHGTYQTNGNLNSLSPYSPSSTTGAATHSQTFTNGSNNFAHFSSETSTNSVHQPTPTYARAPQLNGFNYF